MSDDNGEARKLPDDEKQEHRSLINTISDFSDTLNEIKISPLEVIQLSKRDAIEMMQHRLEPSILINDETVPKRHIFRTIVSILNPYGLNVRLTPGVSIVLTVVDHLFPMNPFKDANQLAKSLYTSHINGRSSGTTS